jgi:ribonuclease HII
MKYTIGIDEVGRGPIAGPIALGAFVFLKKGASRID